MKIGRTEAQKLIEEAGLIFEADTSGGRRIFRAACIVFNVNGNTSTFERVPANLHEMIDREVLLRSIDAAKADAFVQRHHFNKE